jgi:hypothetical protein
MDSLAVCGTRSTGNRELVTDGAERVAHAFQRLIDVGGANVEMRDRTELMRTSMAQGEGEPRVLQVNRFRSGQACSIGIRRCRLT